MNQDRKRDQEDANRQSNIDPAEGSRDHSTSETETGRGSSGERNRMDRGSSGSTSGGITNRPLDRERCEQEQLPERGQSQSER